MTDLLEQSRRRTRLVALGCGAVLAAGTVVAMLPAATPSIQSPSLEVASDKSVEPMLPPLDSKAFDTPVWTIAAAPQPPPPPPPPAPPPPPLRLQLIGILKEEVTYKAVLFDPDTNKLFILAPGEQTQGHTIDRVGADAIAIRDGSLVRTLALKGSPAGGGGVP